MSERNVSNELGIAFKTLGNILKDIANAEQATSTAKAGVSELTFRMGVIEGILIGEKHVHLSEQSPTAKE